MNINNLQEMDKIEVSEHFTKEIEEVRKILPKNNYGSDLSNLLFSVININNNEDNWTVMDELAHRIANKQQGEKIDDDLLMKIILIIKYPSLAKVNK